MQKKRTKFLIGVTLWCVAFFAQSNMLLATAPPAPTKSGEATTSLPFSGEINIQSTPGVSGLKPGMKLTIRPQKTPPEMSCIKKRGRIVVGMLHDDQIPFYMRLGTDEVVGTDVEVAQFIANSLGVKAVFSREAKTVEELVDLVINRKVDLAISGISPNFDKIEQVRVSKSYVTLNKAMMINTLLLQKLNPDRTQSLESLFAQSTSKIGVLRGSPYTEFAQRIFPKAQIIEYESWEQDIVPLVLSGELLAAFDNEWVIRKTMHQIPEAYLRLISVAIETEFDPKVIVVPWSSQQLLAWVNRYLELGKINITSYDLLQKFKDMERIKKISLKKSRYKNKK
ncbi:MAG: transporter substrate-binding domain-containing protein [Pseudomonadota bacterium]